MMDFSRTTAALSLAASILTLAHPADARGPSRSPGPPDSTLDASEEVPNLVWQVGASRVAQRFAGPIRGALCAARLAAFFVGSGERGPRPLFRPLPPLPVRPVEGGVSSPFGRRRDPIQRRRRRHHDGIDFDAERGARVRAAGEGLVVKADRYHGYGRVVFIDHGLGLETRYAHLRRILVEEGQYVSAGTTIGHVGSSGRATGPHLHFEVRIEGEPIDPSAVASANIVPGDATWIDLLLGGLSFIAERKVDIDSGS